MYCVSYVFALLSLVALACVVWLHAAGYNIPVDMFPSVIRVAWGFAVPWFFISSMFWMMVKWRGFGREIRGRVVGLVIPYFCWCVLGAIWSIALHGVQLEGLDLLRYLGIHPWKDPAYQPMWFIRNLFLVLVAEALVLSVIKWRGFQSCGITAPRICAWIFPVYVLHSMFLSVLRIATGLPRFEGAMTAFAVVFSIACSFVTAWGLNKMAPRIAGVIFGGRALRLSESAYPVALAAEGRGERCS